jgi:CRP-like cAMP-binding protein
MSGIWYFENVDLYKILCPHKLKRYETNHFERYGKGDFVYFKEDISRNIYMVNEGKVKLMYYTEEGEEVVKSVLTKGEIFGEMALLGEERRSDFAISVSEPTTLCPLTVDTMYELMRKNQRFSLIIYKIIGLRIKRLERRLEQLFFKDVKTRLAEFICELAEERGKTKDNRIEVDHFYTHKDIADLIGSRRETVTALLNELKEEGLIDYSRNKFSVLNAEKLVPTM